jgi:DinB superfamily
MTLRSMLALVLILCPSAPAAAQIPPGMKVGLSQYLQAGYDGLKSNVIAAANKMPEGDFGFRPSTMSEVRSFAQVLAHIAESQFATCASLRGEPNPMMGRSLEKELSAKGAVLKALQDSFDFCDGAVGRLSDSTASELVKVGRGEAARAAVIAGLLAHTSEMYGIGTVYLRAKNLTPY